MRSDSAERRRLLFAGIFLPTGGAIVVHALASVSLPAALVVAVLGVAALGVFLWRQAAPQARRRLARRIRLGTVAALAATATYDLTRYALVKTTAIDFWPFEALPLFGRALLGDGAPMVWVKTTGILFHVANGWSFGVAYCLAVPRPTVVSAIVWALCLEVLMLAIYPGLFDIRALQELLSVSIAGHIAYGAVLGSLARRLLARRNER